MRTTFRDVRVADQKTANVWLARSSNAVAFAAAVRRRFASHRRFLSSDLVLRRARATVKLQQIFRQLRINVAPRFDLISQPEKHYRMVERRTETRMFPQAGMRFAATPTVERILRRLEFDTTRIRVIAHSGTGKAAATQPATDFVIPKPSPSSLLVQRRTAVSFAPVEMVARQPRRVAFVSADPAPQIEPARPHSDNWPAEEHQRSAPAIDAINMKQLTDHVMEALDRRLVAGQERLKRR